MVIAEPARFWSAAPGTGDGVPALRQADSGTAGQRIDVQNGPAVAQRVQPDG
jgi:hypothetical protein